MAQLSFETSMAGRAAIVALRGESIAVSMQRARGLGRRFALVSGAAQVMRVFDIARMRERLEFVEDPHEVTGP